MLDAVPRLGDAASRTALEAEGLLRAGDVSILVSDGSGQLSERSRVKAGARPLGIAVGDLNRDGRLDLVVANGLGDNVSVLLGDGACTFRKAGDFKTGAGPVAVVAADFNGDGRVDIAVAHQASNNVVVLLGKGDGSFAATAR